MKDAARRLKEFADDMDAIQALNAKLRELHKNASEEAGLLRFQLRQQERANEELNAALKEAENERGAQMKLRYAKIQAVIDALEGVSMEGFERGLASGFKIGLMRAKEIAELCEGAGTDVILAIQFEIDKPDAKK